MPQRKLMPGEIKGVNKYCGCCKTIKDLDQFSRRNRNGKLAEYQSVCKSCGADKLREWKERNPERFKNANRRNQMKYKYGDFTPEDYDRLVVEQDGKCAVCGSTDTQRNRTEGLLIDHNHESGKVRGLLCHPCNVVLGFVRDEPERLQALIDYLKRDG